MTMPADIARYVLLAVSAAMLGYCAFIVWRVRSAWRLAAPVALWAIFAGSFALYRFLMAQPYDVQLLNLWSVLIHIYAAFVLALLLYVRSRNGIGGVH